jgi:lipoyl synthase
MIQQKPNWLKIKLPGAGHYPQVKRLVETQHLHTVCTSAHCPNIGDCWSRRTATFMILGDICSRNCGFCAVDHGRPSATDSGEPLRIAQAVQTLGLRYVVITSVTRDDLADGGAAHFAATILKIKRLIPQCRVEVLIPDLQGDQQALQVVLNAKPDVLNHNLETVPRLYKTVRPQADYQRSLKVIQMAGKQGYISKSGLMLGLGETRDEVLQTAQELRAVGCNLLTLGQYLSPSRHHLSVTRYVTPEEFSQLQDDCLRMGFDRVQASPLVRSSYHADEPMSSQNNNGPI